MKRVQWDDDSPILAGLGIVLVVASTYTVATTDSTNYMHLPSIFGGVFGVWALVLAVVPVLRAKPGTPNRLVIRLSSWAVILVVGVLVVGVTR